MIEMKFHKKKKNKETKIWNFHFFVLNIINIDKSNKSN